MLPQETDTRIIKLDDDPPFGVGVMLYWLYTFDLKCNLPRTLHKRMSRAMDVAEVAEKYQIRSLRDYSVHILQKIIRNSHIEGNDIPSEEEQSGIIQVLERLVCWNHPLQNYTLFQVVKKLSGCGDWLVKHEGFIELLKKNTTLLQSYVLALHKCAERNSKIRGFATSK